MLNSSAVIKKLVGCFVFLQLVSVAYFMGFLIAFGRLPLPFYDMSSDTFMDYFSTLYYSYNDDRYTGWHSVYLPMSFVVARIFGFYHSNIESAFALRSANSVGMVALFVVYFSSIIYVAAKLKSSYPRAIRTNYQLIIVVILIALSGPSLFAIERGNLVLMTFVFLSVGLFSNLERSRAAGIALAVLLKPYLIVILMQNFYRSQWRFLWLTVFFLGLFNLASVFIIGDDNWYLFVENILRFSGKGTRSTYEILINSTSFIGLIKVVAYKRELTDMLPSLRIGLLAVLWTLYFLVFVVTIKTFVILFRERRHFNSESLVFFTVLSLFALLDGMGYHSLILFIPVYLCFLFGASNISDGWRVFSLACFLLLISPLDIGVGPYRPLHSDSGMSYLTGVEYTIGGQVGIMSLIRPFVVAGLVLGSYYAFRGSISRVALQKLD